MENIFCPKCHRLAAQIKREGDEVKVLQNGKVLVSFGKGGNGNNISVNCPSGHSVKVQV